jgi:hypothetical protein
LRAGSLTAVLAGLDILDTREDGVPIASRVGIRVRDTRWGTVPPSCTEVAVDRRTEGFTVSLASRHNGPGIDFAWRGRCTGKADRSLVYEIEGEARSDCRYNRIGIVILHPLDGVAGRQFRTTTPDGTHMGTLPELVAPQTMLNGVDLPLVPAFSRLEIEVDVGLILTVELEGDLFEMEDQRNWTDGSFKTFSTPLALPVPFLLRAGERIKQRVCLSCQDARPIPRAPARPRQHSTLTVGKPLGLALPPIGTGLDSDGHVPDEVELLLLRNLAPAHLRAEVDLTQPDAAAMLSRAGRIAEAVGARLEVVLMLSPSEADIGGVFGAHRPMLSSLKLARIVVLPIGDAVTPPAWLDIARAVFGSMLAGPLVGGTAGNFVELNRCRPQAGSRDGLAYAINPQMHDGDADALIQSLQGQRDTIRTARAFAPHASVHIGPVTLKPRLLGEASLLSAEELPPDVDARQSSCFAASWTAMSIKQLAEAGAASLTYFEMTGWRGIVERSSGSPLPQWFHSQPGVPFAVFHVLRALCSFQGSDLVTCSSGDPSCAQALFVRRNGKLSGIVASSLPSSQRILCNGLPAGGYELQRLGPLGWERPQSARAGTDPLIVRSTPYGLTLLREV